MKEINLLNNPHIFTEGETEKNLISTLFLGRVRIVDLWNTNERALSSLFKFIDKKSTVVIVCDTDVVTDAHKNRFVSNIRKLALATNNQVHILVQKLNFEDELAYAAGFKDKSQLYKAYKVEGEKDFKKKFSQSCNIRNDIKTLNIDIEKLWSRSTLSCFVTDPCFVSIREFICDSSCLRFRMQNS